MERTYVFLVDLDNTLLNNDAVKEKIKLSLIEILGENEALEFWRHHDAFEKREKIADFPRIIHEYCREHHQDSCDLKLNMIFQSVDFASLLFPKAREVLIHLKTLGKVFIYTEGDSIYQKMKVEKCNFGENVDGILLYEHKLDHYLEAIAPYIASQIVYIDDRGQSLARVKQLYPATLTIEIEQGHYSTTEHVDHFPSDLLLSHIEELLWLDRALLDEKRPR